MLRLTGFIVPQARDGVVGGLEGPVADEHDIHVVALLDPVDPVPLLVEHVVAHFDRQLRNDSRGTLLARLLADQAQGRQRQRFNASYVSDSVAAAAHGLCRLLQGRAQSLP